MRWPWEKIQESARPPKVGGTRAPDQVIQIDFTKPHDFYFRSIFEKGDTFVFKRCLLIGFSTPVDDEGNRFRSSEWGHDRWLVLRYPDGRLAYVPRDGLQYIEESLPFVPADQE